MKLAAQYLGNTFKPVKAIAADLGFENEYYFSAIFKQKTASPPATIATKSAKEHDLMNSNGAVRLRTGFNPLLHNP